MLSVPERGLLDALYSVGIGVLSNGLRFGCAARGRGGQASALSKEARSAAADDGKWGWWQRNVRPTCVSDPRSKRFTGTAAFVLGRCGEQARPTARVDVYS
jgi:hypothetical protein